MDVPQQLPRFVAHQQKADDLDKLARILLETGAELPAEVKRGALPTGGDRDRMRGFPIVGKGISGTAPGTDPLGALLAKEHRLRRRR